MSCLPLAEVAVDVTLFSYATRMSCRVSMTSCHVVTTGSRRPGSNSDNTLYYLLMYRGLLSIWVRQNAAAVHTMDQI